MDHPRISKKDLLNEIEELRHSNEDLQQRLTEAEEALEAIRNGEIDALVVYGEEEEKIYTLEGADHSYRVLVETMNEGTATLSEDSLVLYANSRLASLLHTSLEKIQGKQFINFVSPVYRSTFNTLWVQSREGNARGEIELQRMSGTRVPVLLSLSTMQTDGFCGTCLVATDLSEQKKTEISLKERTSELSNAYEELQSTMEELEASEEELRVQNDELQENSKRLNIQAEISHLLAEAGPDYRAVIEIFVRKTAEIFGDGSILRLRSEDGLWLNPVAFYDLDPGAYRLLERSLQQENHPWDEGLAGEVFQAGIGKVFRVQDPKEWGDRMGRDLRDYIERYQVINFLAVPLRVQNRVIGTLSVLRKYPTKEYTHEELLFVQNLADRAAMAIHNARLYQDLEKSMLIEKQMRQQLIRAEKYEALARLVASVVHELNNPLQVVQNALYILDREIDEGGAREMYEIAVSETSRMKGLVEQLRETYRPVKATQASVFNLAEILKNTHTLLVPQLKQNAVKWIITCPQEFIILHGNPDQIKQVFLNICLNAIDAMGSKGGQLSAEVHLETEDRVCIAFRDTGPGIPAENLEKIFEPFFTTKEKGTGLGLSICYEIIKDHGGEISVESMPGEGATFKIFLPVKES